VRSPSRTCLLGWRCTSRSINSSYNETRTLLPIRQSSALLPKVSIGQASLWPFSCWESALSFSSKPSLACGTGCPRPSMLVGSSHFLCQDCADLCRVLEFRLSCRGLLERMVRHVQRPSQRSHERLGCGMCYGDDPALVSLCVVDSVQGRLAR